MTDLDPEEKEILDAYHAGRLEPVALSSEEVARYRAAAHAASRKDARVNIRLPSKDLEGLKIKAMEEGVPYQTLMASVLHKYVTGKLVTR
jgi:predicted DNA binding CopG/RHH family protein